MNPKEVKPPDRIIGPDPKEAERFNNLHGSILPPSRVARGVAAVLGLGTTAFAVEACARPAPPAEVRPVEDIPGAQGTITAQQEQIKALQTAIPQTKTTQPKVAEAPKPAPTAQERKEKEQISPLVLLPINISEADLPYSDNLKCQGSPEPGWKYVNIQFAIGNKSPIVQSVKLDKDILNRATLRSKDGFQYQNPVHLNPWAGCGGSSDATVTFFNTQTFPPDFKAIGAFYEVPLGYSIPNPNDKVSFINRLSFRVGEKTTDYTLNIPSFQELDLTKGSMDINSLRFPTDRPDSHFKEIGTPINVPGKGTITVELIGRKLMGRELMNTIDYYYKSIPEGSAEVKVKIRFHNENKGYGQTFNLVIKLFGEDGILYTRYLGGTVGSKDGYPVDSGEVPPGQENTKETAIITSATVKSGKLVVAGDINEIFNVQLPDPR